MPEQSRSFLCRLRQHWPRVRALSSRAVRRVLGRNPPAVLARVPIDRLLVGGDNGLAGDRFARLSGDIMRTSTPIRSSPQAQLLLEWAAHGDSVFLPDRLSATPYYQNAAFNIDVFGYYFDARRDEEIVQVARRFVDGYRGVDQSALPPQFGQSATWEHVRVRPVFHSDCFQVVDGHHRCAVAAARNDDAIEAVVEPAVAVTALQALLQDTLWLKGRLELYQPLAAPELQRDWRLVRRCTDRWQKLADFADAALPAGGGPVSYLDIGSFYGWFVHQARQRGWDGHGIERDPFAIRVGAAAYKLDEQFVSQGEASRLLEALPRRFDVVSCFSLLHHFVLERQRVSAEEFAALLDRATGKVLVLETGQEHESWYREKLRGWNPDFIEDWIRRHTTFTRVVRLGADADGVGPFAGNFGRMLFACTRD